MTYSGNVGVRVIHTNLNVSQDLAGDPGQYGTEPADNGTETTRRVEARGDLEADIRGAQDSAGLQAGRGAQRLQARRGGLTQPIQAVPDQDAVLVVQRHHVGHHAQRGQGHAVQQVLPEARRHLRPAVGALGQGPGQLERHRRAGQVAERVGRGPGGG